MVPLQDPGEVSEKQTRSHTVAQHLGAHFLPAAGDVELAVWRGHGAASSECNKNKTHAGQVLSGQVNPKAFGGTRHKAGVAPAGQGALARPGLPIPSQKIKPTKKENTQNKHKNE